MLRSPWSRWPRSSAHGSARKRRAFSGFCPRSWAALRLAMSGTREHWRRSLSANQLLLTTSTTKRSESPLSVSVAQDRTSGIPSGKTEPSAPRQLPLRVQRSNRFAAVGPAPGRRGDVLHYAERPASLFDRGPSAEERAPESEFVTQSVSALGDLRKDVVRDGQVVWVEVRVQTTSNCRYRLRHAGVSCGAGGSQFNRAWASGVAVRDEPADFETAEQLGNLRSVQAKLWLIGEKVVEGGRRVGRAAGSDEAQGDVLGATQAGVGPVEKPLE